MSSANKRTPNLSQTSPVAPIDTNSDIEKAVELLIAQMDEGVSIPEAPPRILSDAEKSWREYWKNNWLQLLITGRQKECQRTCDLIEAEMPEKRALVHSKPLEWDDYYLAKWNATVKGFNQALGQTLAVIRRQRLASSLEAGSSPNDKLNNNAQSVEEK